MLALCDKKNQGGGGVGRLLTLYFKMAVVTEDRGPMFKIVLLGEAGVGKTSLFFRLKDNTFTPHMRNTIGIDNCSKHMTVDDQNLTVSGETFPML